MRDTPLRPRGVSPPRNPAAPFTFIAIRRALRPQPGELVIDKATYGAFTRTRLEQELSSRGVRQLYFADVTADVCVHTSLREATDRGFFCHYVTDAISTFDADLRSTCECIVEVEGGIWGELVDTRRAVEELTRP